MGLFMKHFLNNAPARSHATTTTPPGMKLPIPQRYTDVPACCVL